MGGCYKGDKGQGWCWELVTRSRKTGIPPPPPPPSLRGMGGFNANRRKPLEFLVQEETKPATLGSSKYTEWGRITFHWGLDSLDFILKEFRGCVYARGCKAPKHSYPGQGWGREPQGDLEG